MKRKFSNISSMLKKFTEWLKRTDVPDDKIKFLTSKANLEDTASIPIAPLVLLRIYSNGKYSKTSKRR